MIEVQYMIICVHNPRNVGILGSQTMWSLKNIVGMRKESHMMSRITVIKHITSMHEPGHWLQSPITEVHPSMQTNKAQTMQEILHYVKKKKKIIKKPFAHRY